LAFHAFPTGEIVLALGMDSGSVILHELNVANATKKAGSGDGPILQPKTTLSKHEDWVRCIDFVPLGIFYKILKSNWVFMNVSMKEIFIILRVLLQ
jgi:hypothetical protein